MRRSSRIVLAIAVLLSSGLVACGEKETKTVTKVPDCSVQYPGGTCDAGDTCFQGACVATTSLCSQTNATGSCPAGFACWGGGCILAASVPEVCSVTAPSGTCPSGESCFAGSCVVTDQICSATNQDGVCPAGWACYGGGCILEEMVPPKDEVIPVDCTEHPYTTQPAVNVHTAMTRATGTITLTGVLAGNTLTLGGVTFTGVSSNPTDVQFLVGASDTATATNLADAINANATTHALVTVEAVGTELHLTAVADGATGNAVAMASGGTTIVVSGPTLAGGAGSGKTLITVGGLQFRDLNGNGTLDTYEDWRLHPICRAQDLVSKMTFPQKHGLLMEAGKIGAPTPDGTISASSADAIVNYHVRQGLIRTGGITLAPHQVATYLNNVQELAEAQPLGVPLAITEDPTHSRINDKFWTVFPGTLGLGAIPGEKSTWEYGDVTRREFRAVGFHWQLGPMTDVATEPRWGRNSGTFGESAPAVARHVRACITGFQGNADGDLHDGIAATMKHFPGHGPEIDGFDAHGVDGKYTVYPGNNFDYHLIPIQAAIDVGVAAVMPFYPIPKGQLEWDPLQVPGAFAKGLITDLLKKKLGFTGMVTGDWGTLTSRAYGMETLTVAERVALWYEAGSHQFGSEGGAGNVAPGILEAHENGWVTDAQIDDAAAKVLEMTFKLGLFENPYTDPAVADTVVRSPENMTMGFEAMKKSIVLLKRGSLGQNKPLLPITGATFQDLNGDGEVSVYFDGTTDALVGNDFMDNVLGGYDYRLPAAAGNLAITHAPAMADADYAILRIGAASGNDPVTRMISLSYDRNAAARNLVIDALRVRDGYTDAAGEVIAPLNPTLKIVLVITLNAPSILKPWTNGLVSLDATAADPYPSVGPANIRGDQTKAVDGLLAEFGSLDRAVLDVVFNAHPITGWTYGMGKLPFEVPSSDEAVAAQFEDVPGDSQFPTFQIGAGSSY